MSAAAKCRQQAKTAKKGFPVVCVGGSAGGLDAYKRLLTCLPVDLGAAIVIVNHHRVVATQLHEILPYYTKMSVDLITEHLLIRPNRVFIIPSQHDLHVFGGGFRLEAHIEAEGLARCHHRFPSVADPEFSRQDHRGDRFRLRRGRSGGVMRHSGRRRRDHSAEARYSRTG